MKLRPAPSAKSIRARALDSLNSTVSAAMALLLAATTVLAAGRNPNPAVLPPGSAPHGRTYGYWAAAWWTWALQFPLEQNPITDPTGAYGSAGQKGPVWFLAGTFDGPAERSIKVPAGKRIFFPLFNVFNDYSCPVPDNQPAPGQTLEEFLTEGAEAISDMATELFAEVDGVPIQNLWDYRAHSDMEMFTKHPSLLAFDPCLMDGPQPAVAAGYWLMLAPLTRGQHTIRFGSTACFADFESGVDVTYYVTVD
jgi:hypothetical protein